MPSHFNYNCQHFRVVLHFIDRRWTHKSHSVTCYIHFEPFTTPLWLSLVLYCRQYYLAIAKFDSLVISKRKIANVNMRLYRRGFLLTGCECNEQERRENSTEHSHSNGRAVDGHHHLSILEAAQTRRFRSNFLRVKFRRCQRYLRPCCARRCSDNGGS